MKLSRTHILAGILASGLLIRIILFVSFLGTPERFYDDDSFGYTQLAENMRLGNGFSREDEEPFEPDAFRTPGYPLFLLMHRVLTGSYSSALITQSLMVLAIGYIAFRIAEKLGHPRAGVGAAALFVFMPFSIMVSLRFLTQPLFTFLLMLAVWFWMRFLTERSWKMLCVAAVFLPLAALVRPIAIYLYLPFIISLAVVRYREQGSWRMLLAQAAVIVAVFVAGIAPWLIRNYQQFGVSGLSSITSYQLYFYDAPSMYAANHGMTHPQAKEYLEEDIQRYAPVRSHADYFDFSHGPILRQRALDIMFESPVTLVITRSLQFLKFFVRDGIRYWQDWFPGFRGTPAVLASTTERGMLILVSLGALWGLWTARRKEGAYQLQVTAIALVIGYFGALTGIMASAGLRFPVEPLIVLLGMIGLEHLTVRYGILRNG